MFLKFHDLLKNINEIILVVLGNNTGPTEVGFDF